MTRALDATDRLLLGYLGALASLAVLWLPRPLPLLAGIAVLGAAIVALARGRSRSRPARLLHDFFPVVAIVCIFEWTGPVLVASTQGSWDATMAGLDRTLFGSLPDSWFGVLGRPWWLTDAAYVAYVTYYFVPVAMAVALYARGRDREFAGFVFTVVASFLVSYVCYFLFPTTGPRVPAAAEAAVLGGSGVSGAVRSFLRVAEGNVLDAFPSGHTALSLVFLACGWRLFPRWRALLVADVAAIVFSTVYLSLHYVVDVVAGVALAAALPVLLPPIHRIAAAPRGAAARPPGQAVRRWRKRAG